MCHLTITTSVVEFLFDLPIEFSGSNQTPSHPSVGISLAEFKPLLLTKTSRALQGIQQHHVLPKDYEPSIIPNDGPNEVPQAEDLQPPEHMQESEPTNQFPMNIDCSLRTNMDWTSSESPCSICIHGIPLSTLGAIKSASNCRFPPLASLQAFVSTIAQPDGYPDAMSLHVAISQPD